MKSPSRCTLILLVALLQLLVLSKAVAHEIRPAVIDLNYSANTVLESNNSLQVVIVANLESLMAEIGPEHTDTNNSDNTGVYTNFRAMTTDSLLSEFEGFMPTLMAGIQVTASNQDSIQLTFESISIPPVGDIAIPRDTTIYLAAALPQNTTALNWRWDASFGEAIVRANSDSKDLDYAALLSPGQQSGLISFDQPTQQSAWKIILWLVLNTYCPKVWITYYSL